MRHILPLTLILALTCSALVVSGSSWTDQTGKKHETKKELAKKPTVPLLPSIGDAADYLVRDMMKRYPSNQSAYLAVGSFVLTTNGKRTRSSSNFEDSIAKNLERTGKFSMLDRKESLNTDAKLYKRRKSNFQKDIFYFKKFGRTQGADVIMLGTISIGQKYVGISVRLVDVETERVLTVSNCYVPKDKVNAEPLEWAEPKKESDPYLMLLRWRPKPDFDLAAYVESRLNAEEETKKKDKGSKKLNQDELKTDQFEDAPVPEMVEEEGAATEVPAEEGMEFVEEETTTASAPPPASTPLPGAEEEPTPTPDPEVEKKLKKMDKFERDNLIEKVECGIINQGDNIELQFRSNKDGFVFLFSVDSAGRIRRIFPREPNAQFAVNVNKDREFNFEDTLSNTPGCQRICAIVADSPFRLDVDSALLRRLACEQSELDLPWIKYLPPNAKYQQRTLCFIPETKYKLGEDTPTPTPAPTPTPDPLEGTFDEEVSLEEVPAEEVPAEE